MYFITICCQNRAHLFGEITFGVENFQPQTNDINSNVGAENFLPLRIRMEQPKMILNDIGKIADECWIEIPKHFPNAVLHEYVIMPNHIHGIIELVNDANVGAENFLPLPPQNEFQKMIPRSIGSIIKGFKIGITIRAKNILPHVKIWQRNYYEHIIRDEQSYQTISEYIINNPAKWQDDKFYTQ